MKNTIVAALVLSSLSSINFAFADAANFECINPDYLSEYIHNTNAPNCKYINIYSTISIDPSILENYFIGVHDHVCFSWEYKSCNEFSKYSEKITIAAATTTISTKESSSLEKIPTQFAFFDKKFFLPIIKDAYEEADLTFSQNNFDANILLLSEDEVNAQKIDEYSISDYFEKVKNLKKVDPIIEKKDGGIFISTLDYKNYGKYILAPKGNLIESQYLDVKLAKKMPKDEDFGIRSDGSETIISPLTSPIVSIVNYWKYVLIDNKITLVYDKTVATLDTGKTKVLAQNDELNEDTVKTNSQNISSTSPEITTNIVDKSKSDKATSIPPENKTVTLFSKFITLITSWFKF